MLLTCKNKLIFAVSDTHGSHRQVSVPQGVDVVIHCGDACNDGNEEQLTDFFDWFSRLPVKHKIFVAGNHDLPFELDADCGLSFIPDNVIYLHNSGIRIDDLQLFALDAKPWMHSAAELPYAPDILLSHGAPQGILDENIGCPVLAQIASRYKPDFHLFGHIHSQGGERVSTDSVTYCNVSLMRI